MNGENHPTTSSLFHLSNNASTINIPTSGNIAIEDNIQGILLSFHSVLCKIYFKITNIVSIIELTNSFTILSKA